MEQSPTALLTMAGMTKEFPGVQALTEVDLTLESGEVLALLGENGAGKSTLIKTLGGAVRPDNGLIRVDGKPVVIRSPLESQTQGVGIIYQEFNLIPALSVSDNIFLGRERTRTGFIDHTFQRTETSKLFERLGVSIDPDSLCRDLTVAEQQLVEIAKALSLNARILVMDEPSAALTNHEVEGLHRVMRELKRDGIGIIYVSHRLEEIFAVCDRIIVLRDGRNAGQSKVQDVNQKRLIEMMVGRKLEHEFPERQSYVGKGKLEVENLNYGKKVQDVSFVLRKGEILALTGLIGAGRTESVRLIFGADKRDSGSIQIDGREVDIRSPRDAIKLKIGLLTEDRKLQGLILLHSVRENFGLPNLDAFEKGGFLDGSRERDECESYVQSLKIKVPHQEQRTKNLSGGNQQKVVLAKWLARNCDVLIFDEPTRGIDVGAKHEIYLLMNRLVSEGKSILMVSSELPEVLGMADRILVMHKGRITGELDNTTKVTQEQVMELAVA
jgi:ribose transport system ATP-binding protein